MTLIAANTYTGRTTVSGGTLLLGAADRIADTSKMTLSGGTFATGGFNETVGALTLSLASTLDFGTVASVLTYGGVDAWTGLLTINNWTGTPFVAGGTDQLHFSGITISSFMSMVDQSEVAWSGFGSGYQIIGSDGNFEIVPVPEPATIFSSLLLVGLAGWRESRRRPSQGRA